MKILNRNTVVKLFVLIIILLFVKSYYVNKMNNYNGSYKMEVIADSTKTQNLNFSNNTKFILYWNPFWNRDDHNIGTGYKPFQNCKFKNCYATSNKSYMAVENFDALIFHAHFERSSIVEPHTRRTNQIYIFVNMEAPVNVYTNLTAYNSFFNWTMSYRLDSDFPRPHGKFDKGKTNKYTPLSKEQLSGKTKLVAWFVSHCGTSGKREVLVKELQKYIPVDIYGKCGALQCNGSKSCYEMVEKNYKFYFSFENAYCKDYSTEKLYRILEKNIVPVVYSGSDPNVAAPPYSTINVRDFENAKDLANYLIYLDKNDDKYLEYFKWKQQYRPIWSQLNCNLCSKLNEPIKQSIYKDIDSWWRGENKSYCKTKNLLPKIVSDLL